MKLLVKFCLFIFSIDTALAVPSQRIYGGYPIDISEAPYMVHIVYFKEISAAGAQTFYCGGTILRKNLILTAGHCTQDIVTGELEQAERYFVRVGSTFKHSGGTIHNVTKVFVHPKFDAGRNRGHHDIGLLELKDEITISENSQYTKLVHRHDKIPVGTDCVANGWGDNPDQPHDYHLNQIHLNVISAKECAKYETDDEEGLAQHEICGKSKNKNVCSADSGGPLVDTRNNRQIGVISYDRKDCTEDAPSVFASIQDNMDYINHVIMKTSKL